MIKLIKILSEIKIQGNNITPEKVIDVYNEIFDSGYIALNDLIIIIKNVLKDESLYYYSDIIKKIYTLDKHTLNILYHKLSDLKNKYNINEIKISGGNKLILKNVKLINPLLDTEYYLSQIEIENITFVFEEYKNYARSRSRKNEETQILIDYLDKKRIPYEIQYFSENKISSIKVPREYVIVV